MAQIDEETVNAGHNNILSKISNVIERILIIVSIILSAGLALNMIVAVFFRYALSKPIFWADELSLILFVWITFLGGCLALKKSEMPAVTLIIDRLNLGFRLIFSILIHITVITFSVIIAYYSYTWITSPSVMNMISSTLRISMMWIYLILPITMVCMIIFSISNLYNDILDYRNNKGGHQ